jgi:membrane-bound lytic murein transglycosylase D
MIEQELGEHGVPAELAYLPMVESRFRPDAVGRRAVGLWQFTRSTARKYGLTVNRSVDERRDPAKSTRAAARYLRDLYDQFESWDLALAAYNAGPGRVHRALRRRPEATFFELASHRLLPPITRRYVPKVLAIALIGPQPARYGVEVRQGIASGVAVRRATPDAHT